MKNNSKYFKNTECEYYPCHKTEGDFFNCMFCYCPLYTLGEKCGGSFEYTEDGIKDCSKCLVPHSKNGYSYINQKFPEISEIAKVSREKL